VLISAPAAEFAFESNFELALDSSFRSTGLWSDVHLENQTQGELDVF